MPEIDVNDVWLVASFVVDNFEAIRDAVRWGDETDEDIDCFDWSVAASELLDQVWEMKHAGCPTPANIERTIEESAATLDQRDRLGDSDEAPYDFCIHDPIGDRGLDEVGHGDVRSVKAIPVEVTDRDRRGYEE